MIQEVKMYTVVCDNCKDTLETYDGFAAWHDQDDAEETARNKDWLEMGNAFFCTDCYKHDDKDELVIDGSRFDKFKKHTL